LVGAPITGGGPLHPSGSPWTLIGVLASGIGGATLYARFRRVHATRL
jgi:hypothetical protein